MVKSYIKLYGPPIHEGIRVLERIALETTSTIPVSYFHACLPKDLAQSWQGPQDRELASGEFWRYNEYLGKYYTDYNETCAMIYDKIKKEDKDKIISKSGEKLGEYDFFFEYLKDPSHEDLFYLIDKIDKELTKINLRYSITTK